MPRIEHRTYSRASLEALTLLGKLIQLARKQRRMTAAELAERTGISRSTLQRIEKGDPKVEVGLMFEAAALVGVPLFDAGPGRLVDKIARADDKLALLPKAIHKADTEVNDAF
ncbi:MAG: helix-turn-helix transcriptional regulator [Thiobacillus sp.]|nr:helix-turn-helix transcriptional regulator [Thiobacillus sp.]